MNEMPSPDMEPAMMFRIATKDDEKLALCELWTMLC